MLKIKLARFGKKKQPAYRIVVNEAKSKRDGQYVAMVGRYAPTESPKILEVDMPAYEAWLKKGAQPTETVASLVTRLKSGNPFPPKKSKPNKKAMIRAAAEAEAKAAEVVAPAEPVVAEVAAVESAETEVTA